MKVKDLAYFEHLLETITSEEVDQAICEMEEYLAGIEKGLKVLKKIGKYPDKVVLENQKGFTDLIVRYKKKFNKI